MKRNLLTGLSVVTLLFAVACTKSEDKKKDAPASAPAPASEAVAPASEAEEAMKNQPRAPFKMTSRLVISYEGTEALSGGPEIFSLPVSAQSTSQYGVQTLEKSFLSQAGTVKLKFDWGCLEAMDNFSDVCKEVIVIQTETLHRDNAFVIEDVVQNIDIYTLHSVAKTPEETVDYEKISHHVLTGKDAHLDLKNNFNQVVKIVQKHAYVK